MLFCESVITVSNKKRLRQFGTRDHSDASNEDGMSRGDGLRLQLNEQEPELIVCH
jgi:hypothetical protein